MGVVAGLVLATLIALALCIVDLVHTRGWNLVGVSAVVLSGLFAIGSAHPQIPVSIERQPSGVPERSFRE